MLTDSALQLENLCREIEHRKDREFVASLFGFLAHLQNDAWCRAATADLHRDEQASIAMFTNEANQIAEAIGKEHTEIESRRAGASPATSATSHLDDILAESDASVGRAEASSTASDAEDEYDPLSLQQCAVLMEHGDDAILLSPGTLPLVYSRTRRALEALRHATSEEDVQNLDDIGERVAVLETRYQNAWRKRHIDALVSAAAALSRLEDAMGILGKTAPRTSAEETARQIGAFTGGSPQSKVCYLERPIAQVLNVMTITKPTKSTSFALILG
jgi:hypothetical protein